MHPLDRVHDTMFDKHEVKKAVRRTSLDNSCLQDKQDVLAIMVTGSTCLDNSNHNPVRRLSLNNVMAKPTTFLATPAGDQQPKTELDMDYHVGEDDDDDIDGDSGLPDCNSFVCQGSFSELSRHVISEDEEELGQDESSLLSDGDSFCEATDAEPANREYIVKELGASCFWEGDEEGDHNISDAELAEFEALENGEHESTENGLENLEEVTDEHSDDCDSFCDANEKEPANREYLVKDLGASLFWGSSDGLDMGIESPRRSTRIRSVASGQR